MKCLCGLLVIALSCVFASAQNGAATKTADKAAPAVAVPDAMGPAKAAFAAHGGDKLKKMKTMLVKGSVDVNTFGQATPGAFSTAISGDKYYFEINSIQQLKQVYDGRETFSSIQGFSLPPVTSLGIPLLARLGDEGYVVSALPATSKKKRGFRLTTPEGFYTDFGVDEKTSQVKSYESAFELNGRVVTTSVEVDEFLTVEGVVLPKKYAQRFDLGPITAYANFKAKEILVNTKIEDSAFAIPR
ncbi:MAG: hypothetical protein ABL952_14635 [Pyrinomonadaceae bacterium]